MKKILIFGGTSEEHTLISRLRDYPVEIMLCVASDYGASMLSEENKIAVHTGRLDADEIAELIRGKGFNITVDATHPYAVQVTENIKKASSETGIPYIRLLRQASKLTGMITVQSVREAADRLIRCSGNVLITTGSKELIQYTHIPDYSGRLYTRVLPTQESIGACISSGFLPSHIIAMQGPFSKELNIALMEHFEIKILVTKDGGTNGGFLEKIEAARELGVRVIVISRPGDSGLSQSEAIMEADVIIGANRLLKSLPEECSDARYSAIQPEDIKNTINKNMTAKSICILMSGDVGFYSGAQKLYGLLRDYEVDVLPGITSLQYFAAKLKQPWQDWKLVSAHGKNCNAANFVKRNTDTFFLTGGENTAQSICAQLRDAGFGKLNVTIGENLGSENERIYSGTVDKLSHLTHSELSVMLVNNPEPFDYVSCGLDDNAYLRGNVPMTKSEVRSVILSKLRLSEFDILYDVGAGTGSVSIEAALVLRSGHVYAIERRKEGCNLIQENALRLGVSNLSCIEREAPSGFMELPIPDAVFIGGTGGKLNEILDSIICRNSKLRIVISAISLETVAEAISAFDRLSIINTDIVQIAVSRGKMTGERHLMIAQNPIFIISGGGLK